MAVVVEDGSIVANANSYADETALDDYAAARGVTITGDQEQRLVQAMDYIENQAFLGSKLTKAQTTQWPRSGVTIDGFTVEEDEIPTELINAQLATALSIDGGNNPLSDLGRETKREKVGDLEVEYADSAREDTELRAVDTWLSKLLVGGGGNGYVEIVRA